MRIIQDGRNTAKSLLRTGTGASPAAPLGGVIGHALPASALFQQAANGTVERHLWRRLLACTSYDYNAGEMLALRVSDDFALKC
ncbi:MAG: hypothetical protein ACYTFA_11160 [Planctomycetota bacterium]|jgi:hypothetical protein